jgi:transposase-like protein
MPKIRSRRTSAEERAVTIRKYRSSGLTQRAFCEAEGLSVSTFQNWLKHRAGGVFTEVVSERRATTCVELMFPDGTAVRIRSE